MPVDFLILWVRKTILLRYVILNSVFFNNAAAPKRTLLTFLLVSLVSLFAVGCGDSNEDYVFTGTNPGVTTGNVNFQFEEAVLTQAALVPAGTDFLTFDFFVTNPPAAGQLIFEADAPYANSVTVQNVPTSARSVVITAFDADGFPLATITAPINVVANTTTNANLNGVPVVEIDFTTLSVSPNPVALTLGTLNGATEQLDFTLNFNNGISYTIAGDDLPASVVASYAVQNSGVATVNATGTVTAVEAGTTNGTATLSFGGTTVTAPFTVNVTGGVITPVTVLGPVDGEITLPTGGFEYALIARVGFENATTDVALTAASNYDVSVSGTAVTFNETTGTLATADSVVAANETSTVTVTNPNGLVVESFNVTAGAVYVDTLFINDDEIGLNAVNATAVYTIDAVYVDAAGNAAGSADVTYSPSVLFTLEGPTDVAEFDFGIVRAVVEGTGTYYIDVPLEFQSDDYVRETVQVFVGL